MVVAEPDDLDRGEHLAAQQEFARLVDLELAEQVAAIGDVDAGPLRSSSERRPPSMTRSFLASMSPVMPNSAARSFIA